MAETFTLLQTAYNYENEPLGAPKSWVEIASGEIIALNDRGNAARAVRVNVTDPTIPRRVTHIKSELTDTETLYYTVTSYTMLNDTVCEFKIVIDPFMSFFGSGSSYYIVRGMITRLTPKGNEEEQTNILPEPWTPTHRMSAHVVREDDSDLSTARYPVLDSDSYQLVATTVSLKSAAEADETITAETKTNDTGSTTEYHIIRPQIEGGNGITVEPSDTYGYARFSNLTYPGVNVYCVNRTGTNILDYTAPAYKYGLGKLQALGLTGSIIGRWLVPSAYVTLTNGLQEEMPDSNGTAVRIDNIIGKTIEPRTVSLSDGYASTTDKEAFANIVNAKAKYLFATITVSGVASGSSKTFNWSDVANDSNYAQTSWGVIVNPFLNGRPYIYSLHYKGVNASVGGILTETVVAGRQWSTPLETATGADGSTLTDYFASQRNMTNVSTTVRDLSQQGVGAVAKGVLLNIPGAIKDLVSMSNKSEDALREYKQNEETASIEAGVYTPTVYPSTGIDGLGGSSANNFRMIIQNLKIEDMQAFDKFLTYYGYSVRQFTTDLKTEYLDESNSRGSYFCYVQMSGADVMPVNRTTGNFQQDVASIIRNQLNNGVRLWRQGSPRADVSDNT